MEAYGALELLSQGLGDTHPVADCTRSLREPPHVNDTENAEDIELGGSSVHYGSGLASGASSQVSISGFGGGTLDPGAGELASAKDPPLSRPISAPPDLGAISASTLFAFPPAESAGCVDFLLSDIRYDKQYCEFYRNHARDNPSLPKPLEEPSLLDLLPRLRTRGSSKHAKDSDNLSSATAGDSVSTSSENRGEVLAAAAAALLRQTSPEASQRAATLSPAAAEVRDSGGSSTKLYEASKVRPQQQTWGGSYAPAGVPAAASRVGTTTTRATYSGSSTEKCNPNGEEEGEGDFAPGSEWCSREPFCGDDPLVSISRGGPSQASMGAAAPLLETEGTSACGPSFPAFYSAQQLASTGGRALRVHEPLDASVGALLGSGHNPSLGPPRMETSGLGGSYGGASGNITPSTANAVEVPPRASLTAPHHNVLDVQHAAAAAWLMGRQGHLSPLAASQGATGEKVSDALLASTNLRLHAALDLGASDSPCAFQEQLHRRQLSSRHARDQRRRNRTENSIYEQKDALDCWGKPVVLQQGFAASRDVRGVAELPLMATSGRSRSSLNESGVERLGNRGGGSRGRGGASGATSRHDEPGPPPRFSCADVLHADDGSLFRTAKDQGGCRLLQRLLAEGTPEEVDRVFNMAFARLVELMTDAYGNYLFQKLLDVCSDEQLQKLLDAITPHLLDICLDPHGTRTAQKLVEVICGSRQNPSLTTGLISAFKPLVVDLATNANGNHVIKRFLWCSTRENNACNIDFILQAACDHCVHIATERHGCCVMQRCCEAASGVLKDQLLSEVANNALRLSQDPFGNYVVQHVLRHDHTRVGAAIIMRLRGHMRELSEQKFASNVVEKCLLLGDSEQRAQVIGELLEEPQELQKLVLHAYGNYVVQRALAVAGTTQREALLDVVRFSLVHQHTSQHSRIAQKLMRRFRGLRQPPGTPSGGSSSNGSWCCSVASASPVAAAQVEWGATDCLQHGAGIRTGQVPPSGVQVQTLCRQQQRQQQHPVDSHRAVKPLSGDSPVEGAEFGFRPVSPL